MNNDGDFFEVLFAKLNSTPIEPADDPHSRLAGLIGFFDHLIDVGENSSTFAKIRNDERAQLLTAMKDVKTHSKAVIEYFRRTDHPTLDASVLRLLVAAYHIGEFANASDTAKGVGQSEGATPGGIERGVQKQDEAQRWHSVAETEAKNILRENPKLPATDLARRVRLRHPKVMPAYDRVRRHLGRWRKKVGM